MSDYFSIIFGDGPDAIDIGRMVDAVTNIERGIGSSWENDFTVGVGRYGQSWTRGRLKPKPISIEFIKEGDQHELSRFRRELARALDCPNGPKRLTFNDQPNCYYMAVTDGSITLKEDISELRATGTINFIVPDGLLYESAITVLNSESDESIGSVTKKSDHVEIVLNNPSSVDVYPLIKIKNNSENGYIGIVHQNGVMELGSKDTNPQGENVLSTAVDSSTILRIPSKNRDAWNVFKSSNEIASKYLTAPHDSNMNVRVGTIRYNSRDILYSVGSPLKAPSRPSGYSVGSIPMRSKTYMGPTEPKGFAAKLVVTYKSTDVNSRTSVVHADLYIVNVTRAMSFTEWDINYTIKIGDTHINHSSRPNMAPQYGGVWEARVMSNDFTVRHDSSGRASVSVLGAINGRNQAWYVPGYFQTSGNFELPTINYAPPTQSTSAVNGFTAHRQNVSGLEWSNQPIENSAYKWAGGIAVYELPKDNDNNIITAKNFKCDFNIKFWENAVGQTGRITVGFLDKNDELICAYDVSKDDQNGENAVACFYTGRDDVRETISFGANNNELNQNKPNVAFNNKAGNVSVIKEGSRVTFTYADKPYSYNLSKLSMKECARIYIASGGLFSARSTQRLVHLMMVESLTFTNNYMTRYDLVPNRYKQDTRIVVDLFEGDIVLYDDLSTKEGRRVMSELIHGSRFFSIKPGTNLLRVRPSPWCRYMPDVEVEWTNRWL